VDKRKCPAGKGNWLAEGPQSRAKKGADGAQTISDIAVLGDQSELFGAVASDSTCWRVLDAIGTPELAAIHRARAAARGLVWAQRAEITESACPPARAGDRQLTGLVIDLDVTIMVCHSNKEQTAPTFKHAFGYHPMVAFLDNTGDALAECCARATPKPTPPPITSACSTLRWSSFPTRIATESPC